MIFKSILIFGIILLFFQQFNSKAYYNFDGFPITWQVYGKIHGELYVNGGHGLDATPYTEEFSLPEGDNIAFGFLLIGIWGGSEYNTGWLEAYINTTSLGRQTFYGTVDQNLNFLSSAHGVIMVYYNITDKLDTNKTFEIKIETGGSLDGRIYGITLICFINKTISNATKFSIGFGNVALHYLIQGKIYNEFTFNFNDAYNQSEFQFSTLYTANLATALSENDYLYFNDQLLDSNSGDESAGNYFDLDSYDVLNFLSTSNSIKINRGQESYIHPILAVLSATYKPGLGNDEDYLIYNDGSSNPFNGNPINVEFIILIIEIIGVSAAVFSLFYFQYRRKRKKVEELGN